MIDLDVDPAQEKVVRSSKTLHRWVAHLGQQLRSVLEHVGEEGSKCCGTEVISALPLSYVSYGRTSLYKRTWVASHVLVRQVHPCAPLEHLLSISIPTLVCITYES